MSRVPNSAIIPLVLTVAIMVAGLGLLWGVLLQFAMNDGSVFYRTMSSASIFHDVPLAILAECAMLGLAFLPVYMWGHGQPAAAGRTIRRSYAIGNGAFLLGIMTSGGLDAISPLAGKAIVIGFALMATVVASALLNARARRRIQ
jgi:hypothetical protein